MRHKMRVRGANLRVMRCVASVATLLLSISAPAGLVGATLCGCVMNRDAAMPQVRIRAEKDLTCKKDKIEVETQLGGRYKATGCGRTVTYDSVCEGLQCQVSQAGEEAPAWRDRPDPGSPDDPTR